MQVGLDIPLGTTALVNLEVCWNGQRSAVNAAGARLFQLEVDPLTLGARVGFRF